MEYLYGIETWQSKIRVVKTEIIKETAKQFVIKDSIEPYQTVRVYKDDLNLAHSPKQAIDIFICILQAEIDRLEEQIEHMRGYINQAERIEV